MFKSSRNTLIFFATILIMIVGFRWSDGYAKAKINNQQLSFTDYVKNDSGKQIQTVETALRSLPEIIKEFIKSEDKIKIGLINKTADALEVYHIDKGIYPPDLKTITEQINNQKNKESINNLVTYTAINNGNGYELSVKLRNGNLYKLNR